MIILHTCTDKRIDTQKETQDFIKKAFGEDYRVKSVRLHDSYSYDDAMKNIWGLDNLLIIEQDIVPTIEQIHNMYLCDHDWCCFGYQIKYKDVANAPLNIIYGLGCTKFSLRQQQQYPVEMWYKKTSNWAWYNLDSRIVNPMVSFGCVPFVHGEVKHNRIAEDNEY